ncbi:Hypothetical protein SMAX5B_008443 [Scophthalmus maximus]|uniref:Uncharacterized protein n=1 Tax=Scophthalmus maximus TaxID=52904 RepID=A0A2U9B3I2_SCOMX|nr:Hypothetical protein SMAX5B_008443 [Scophthalmus maximus]
MNNKSVSVRSKVGKPLLAWTTEDRSVMVRPDQTLFLCFYCCDWGFYIMTFYRRAQAQCVTLVNMVL